MNGELVLVEPDLLAELAQFSLAGLPADLPGFSKGEAERPYLIDLDRGHLKVRQDDDGRFGLDLDASAEGVRREDVIRELDRRVRRDDVLQADMIAWIGRALDALVRRGIELTYMARHANQLAEEIARTLKALEQTRRNAAFQATLFGDGKPRLSEFHAFTFGADAYPARWLFNGRWQFTKHYYPLPGELKPEIDGEETGCAIEIDGMAEMKHWIRNLERQAETSFWLPTSTDRFYPDFVAELKDGRLLAVEYKGAHLYNADDAREKRDIGDVWAAASGGRCLFKVVTDATVAGKSVSTQLREALSGR